jgi:phosphoglycerate dehydrogenase-like enzyme
VIYVAEHTVLQLLTVAKKAGEVQAVALAASPDWGDSRRTDENTFAYNWSNRQNISGLYTRTVGITGFGEIGAELARRLKPWGCQVQYHRRRRLPAAVEEELGLLYVDEPTLIRTSDFVVNLLPYFPETFHRLNADWFAAMKPGAFVVSCGSGGTIDETALAQALERGHLAGAALDTFDYEPLPADNPLVRLARAGANLLLTPHTAAGASTAAATDKNRADEFNIILHHVRGEPVPNRVI